MSALRLGALLATLMLFAACGSTRAPPDWQMNANASLERAVAAYLEGNQRLEALEFARARSDVSRTGRADLLARVELTRCAARVASLEFDECPAYVLLAVDAGPAERAYAAFLAGRHSASDVALLPAAYRGVAAGAITSEALGRIEDPLSRLVVAGVLMRDAGELPGLAELATATASGQGWRRPLLAWLEVRARRADAAGESLEAQRLRRRIGVVLGKASEGAASR